MQIGFTVQGDSRSAEPENPGFGAGDGVVLADASSSGFTVGAGAAAFPGPGESFPDAAEEATQAPSSGTGSDSLEEEGLDPLLQRILTLGPMWEDTCDEDGDQA